MAPDGGIAVGLAAQNRAGRAERIIGDDGAMRLLILGGTWYLGRAIGELALDAGWQVTTFNRGVSAPDLAGIELVHGDRERSADLRRLAQRGPWDAVIDTIGYIPKQVLDAATAAVDPDDRLSSAPVVVGGFDPAADDARDRFDRKRFLCHSLLPRDRFADHVPAGGQAGLAYVDQCAFSPPLR
jgi:NAD(P)-dependent dehydrogenase (short-subunit alcohol dehydrogenase family)